MNNQPKNKKNAGCLWGFLVLLFPFLTPALSGELPPAVLAGMVLVIAGIIVVIKVAGKQSQAAKNAPDRRGPQRASAPDHAVHRPDPRTKSFTAPDPYCVTCENTGEDHFVRDRQQRIAQLDEWLKNGIVDKDEYRVLKQRFERDQ